VADNYARGYTGEVGSPKSGYLRSVPMADRLAGELERHFQRSAYRGPHDLVFCHPETGHVFDASKLRKRFAAALERAEVNVITFHELRHTFGTQMAAAGAPLRAVQEWLGHADQKTTEIYAHYAPDSTNGAAFAERVRAWIRACDRDRACHYGAGIGMDGVRPLGRG
jgi:integrase